MHDFPNTRKNTRAKSFTKKAGDLISNRFLIEKCIGHGESSEVYLVKDQHFHDSEKALKLITSNHLNEDSLRSFKKQFQFLQLLNHPGFVHGYDIGRTDSHSYFFTMEHVVWPTLAKKSAKLTTKLSLDLLYYLAEELSYIHNQQIAHLDLKPNNIFVNINALFAGDGQELPIMKICDFGLSSNVPLDEVVCDNDTFTFSAPEMFIGGRVDSRADIFSFGMIAYTLLTKLVPYSSNSKHSMSYQKRSWTPDITDWKNSNVTPELSALLTRCLNPIPNFRPSNISEVIAELSRITGQSYDGISQFFHIPFVGRTKEKRYLSSKMHDVKKNEQWAFVYQGDPEVGKSRLIDELATIQQIEGAKVVRVEGQDVTPLSFAFNPDQDGDKAQLVYTDLRELWPSISEQFLYEVSTTPIVICWHKFDEVGIDSVATFKEILLNHPNIPVMWLLESKHKLQELGALVYADHLITRSIGPLKNDEIEELIGRILSKPRGYKRLGRQLHSFVGGRPDWLAHSLIQLANKNHIVFQDGRWSIPNSELSISEQDPELFVKIDLNKLTNSTRLVLEWLAVLNRRCEIEVVRSQLEIDPNVWSLISNEISEIGLIQVTGGVIDFRLPVLRQFVYQSMSPSKRKEMHLWIGRWLEENISTQKAVEIRQTIAKHYLIAGESTLFLGSVEELLDIARDPMKLQLDTEILEFALEITDYHLSQSHKYQCMELLGNTYLKTNCYEQATEIFQKLLTDPGSRRYTKIGVLHMNIGKCLILRRKYEKANFHFHRAHNLFETEYPDLAAESLGQLALIAHRLGNSQRGYTQTRKYHQLIEKMQTSGKKLNHWLICAKLYMLCNKFEKAQICYLNIINNAKTSWDNPIVVSAHQCRIEILIKEGEWKEAEKLIIRIENLNINNIPSKKDWHLPYQKVIANFSGGRIDKGMQLYEKLKIKIKSHAKPLSQLKILLNLIKVDYNSGYYWQGMKLIREAMGISRRLGVTYFTTVVYAWAIRYKCMMGKNTVKLAAHTKQLIQKERHPASTCVAASMLGEYYLSQNQLLEAAKLIDLSIANSNKIDFEVSVALLNIMKSRIIQMQKPDQHNSIKFSAIESSFENIKPKAELGSYYREMMHYAIQVNEKELAKYYYKKTIEKFKKINSRYLLAKSSMDYVDACLKWDLSKAAASVYSSASKIFKELHLPCPLDADLIEKIVGKEKGNKKNEKDRELKEIDSMIEMLNSAENPDVIIENTLQLALDRLNGTRGFVIFKREKTSGLSRKASFVVGNSGNEPFLYDLANDVLKKNSPVFLRDLDSDKSLESTNITENGQIYSIACFPILSQNMVAGVVYFDFTKALRELSSFDKNYISIISNLIGLVRSRTSSVGNLTSEKRFQPPVLNIFDGYEEFKGRSASVQKIFSTLELLRGQESPVLISGECGTGKELIAKIIHRQSKRSAKTMVIVNCAVGQDSLIESRYFGHVKGAFTGAIADKVGFFELANGSTIFLDEIDKMSMEMQGKLLRVLQNGEYTREGDPTVLNTNVRLITATNANLKNLMKCGKFRDDLYYRINVVPIKLPPLRERVEDIPILATHFLNKIGKKYKKTIKGISSDAISFLQDYTWSGNVRELENTIEHIFLYLKDGDHLDLKHLEFVFEDYLQEKISKKQASLVEAVNAFESELIRKAIADSNGNRAETARRLGISRAGLFRKMKKLGLL